MAQLLPREILLHIFQFVIDGMEVIPTLANVNKEWREITHDDQIWTQLIQTNNYCGALKNIISAIPDEYPHQLIFSKLQTYFQSRPFLQYFLLLKEDSVLDTHGQMRNSNNDNPVMVFEPFTKLIMRDGRKLSELMQFFGVNAYNALCFADNKNKASVIKCSEITETAGFEAGIHGENVQEATFVLGEGSDERWITTYLITYRDKKKEVKEPPVLTCPELGITVSATNSVDNCNELVAKMREVISSRYGKKASFVCFEKIRVKKSKLFRITKKEETKSKRAKQIAKQKRFDFWFGNEGDSMDWEQSSESFFRFNQPFHLAV